MGTAVKYNTELPIYQHIEEIKRLLAANQCIVVAGDTGSGKTTQLPKICLELGLAEDNKLIGHTQPRRIAATSIATRISTELEVKPGVLCGHKIRFNQNLEPSAKIKVMTDGILLKEMQSSKVLAQYSVLIIDEAHERSLNIDLILGLLKNILPKRPDLKVIITSATIDVEKFSNYFNNCPIVTVSGRLYPIETKYIENDNKEQHELILENLQEINNYNSGDVLVFLATEREINETIDYICKHKLLGVELLPLYGRLSNAEQNKIFAKSNCRKIIFSTNIAETSVTVPNIRYVIDAGTARVSRYNYKSGVQRLPIENISKASCSQRQGRAGRVAPGICIRLYSEQDYNLRADFTEPEIIRTNLTSVVLHMLALGIDDIYNFPFLDAPKPQLIKDAFKILFYLKAIDEHNKLSGIGKNILRFPIDVKLAKIILASVRENCLSEALIIATGLSVLDPRIEQQHGSYVRYYDKNSDFVSFVKLWEYIQENKANLSNNKFKKLCEQEGLSIKRIIDWQDLYKQVEQVTRDLKLTKNQLPASFEQIHKAVLSGFINKIGKLQEERQYLGAFGKKFYIFPGSNLKNKTPKWCVSSGVFETSRNFARLVAKIEPEWIEEKASHIIKLNYSEPHFRRRRGDVGAYQSATILGVPLYTSRKVAFGKIDPVLAREIFIRHTLIYQESDSLKKHDFLIKNNQLIDEVLTIENKARTRDILVDEQDLFVFYNDIIPHNICSIKSFEKWIENFDTKQLIFNKAQLIKQDASLETKDLYPDKLTIDNYDYKLEYVFEHDSMDDGVSVYIPTDRYNLLAATQFSYLVPGLLEEKILELLKTLPKPLRKSFFPVKEFARAVFEKVAGDDLLVDIAKCLTNMTGCMVKPSDFNEEQIPQHLRINYKLINHNGKIIKSSRDFEQLAKTSTKVVTEFIKAIDTSQLEQKNITDFPKSGLEEFVFITKDNNKFKLYPAINKTADKVEIKLFQDITTATKANTIGLAELIKYRLTKQLKYLNKEYNAKLLPYNFDDVLLNVLVTVFELENNIIYKYADFEALISKNQLNLVAEFTRTVTSLENIFKMNNKVLAKINLIESSNNINSINRIQLQLSELLHENFLMDTPNFWLHRIVLYLNAIEQRLDMLQKNPSNDIKLDTDCNRFFQLYLKNKTTGDFRWYIEEYRLAVFGQRLKPIEKITVKKLTKMFNEENSNAK